MEKISLVMASRNEGEELQNTLHSIYDSVDKYDPEIIVIDDASEDGSCNNLDSRVNLVVNHKQMGMSRGRERGLRFASGEVLCILDPHMRFEKGLFDRLYDVAKEGCFAQPKIGVLHRQDNLGWEAEIKWKSNLKFVGSSWTKKATNQALMCPAWAFPRMFLSSVLEFYDTDARWWWDDSTISVWAKFHKIAICRLVEFTAQHLFKQNSSKTWGSVKNGSVRKANYQAYTKIFHPLTCRYLFGIEDGGLKDDATKKITDCEFFSSIGDRNLITEGDYGSVTAIEN